MVTGEVAANSLGLLKEELEEAIEYAKDIYRNTYMDAFSEDPSKGHAFYHQAASQRISTMVTSDGGLFRKLSLQNGKKTFAAFVKDVDILGGKPGKPPLKHDYWGIVTEGESPRRYSEGIKKLDEKVKELGGVKNLLESELHGDSDPKLAGFNIESQDTYDLILKQAAKGEKITMPKVVEHLYKQQFTYLKDPKEQLNRTAILNLMLKKGVDPAYSATMKDLGEIDIVPPGSLELAENNIKLSPIDFGDLPKYSTEELQTLGVLASIWNEGQSMMSKDLDELFKKAEKAGTTPIEQIFDPKIYSYRYYIGE